MTDLCWSHNPPGTPGFYWYRVRSEGVAPVVLEVREFSGVLCLCVRGEEISVAPVDALSHAEWAGPIDQPREIS